MGRWVTPDLSALADVRTDAELERSIRHGVNDEGRSVLAMPSEMLAGLSDEDLGKILASLRAESPALGAPASRRLGPLVRFLLLRGAFEPAAAMIDHSVTPPTRTPTAPLAFGEYLAMTACTECHGLDLLGSPAAGPAPAFPPLAVVAGYTREQFGRLMREGVPASEIELGLMKDVAVGRFAHFTTEEVSVLFTYLNDAATWERSGGGGSE
jgi:cytochrome c553